MLTTNEVENNQLDRLAALQEVDQRLKDRRDRMTALVSEADGYELELARQRECVVEEGHLNLDHVHMLLSIPPKYAVAQVLGFIKGKSAIHIARTYLGRRQNFTGQHFWARGYYVSTVGRDEATIREYIKKQEAEDQRLDQLEIFAR